MRSARLVATVSICAMLSSAALVACGGPADTRPRHSTPTVVASTDVWGSVARAVAGDHATVTSIINGDAADPHSFEASPANAAALTDASLVVYNGGGYDQWVDDVLATHPGVPAVDAYSLLTSAEQPANEHVFYDPATAKAVAAAIGDKLAGIDPAHADAYRADAADFGRQADAIAASEHTIATTYPHAAVAATEPVAHYLLVNAALTDRTPPGFASAIEDGDDPAPADVAAMLDLINGHQIRVLLVNPQTESPAIKQIVAAARDASIPTLTVTETLPEGTDYLRWQRQTVAELADRLSTTPPANR